MFVHYEMFALSVGPATVDPEAALPFTWTLGWGAALVLVSFVAVVLG